MTDRQVTDLKAAACADCIPHVTTEWQRGLGGRVLVGGAGHEPTCPWLAGVLPPGSEAAVISNQHGILVHYFAESPGGVGGE